MPFDAFVDQMPEEPDFVNDKGFKFFAEISLTKYARRKLGSDKYIAYAVVMPDNNRTYLLCHDQSPEYDDQTYEGIACHIDMLHAYHNME